MGIEESGGRPEFGTAGSRRSRFRGANSPGSDGKGRERKERWVQDRVQRVPGGSKLTGRRREGRGSPDTRQGTTAGFRVYCVRGTRALVHRVSRVPSSGRKINREGEGRNIKRRARGGSEEDRRENGRGSRTFTGG